MKLNGKVLSVAALALLVAGGAWAVGDNGLGNDATLTSEAIEDEHLKATIEVDFTSVESAAGGYVDAKVTDQGMTLERSPLLNRGRIEKDAMSPDCATACRYGMAHVEIRSDPGKAGQPYTVWSELDKTAPVKPGATAEWTLEVGLPGKAGTWNAYGDWTVTVRPFTVHYENTGFGWSVSYEQKPDDVGTYTVKEA